jgi:hypothetical protein
MSAEKVLDGCSDYIRNWVLTERACGVIVSSKKRPQVKLDLPDDEDLHNAVGIISKVDHDTGKCTVKLDHMREGRFVEAEVLLGSCIDATSDFTSDTFAESNTEPTDCCQTLPDLVVSSSAVKRSPAKVIGCHLVRHDNTLQCIDDPVIFDMGSGTCILGYDTAEKWQRHDPKAIVRVGPSPTSIRRIRGVGLHISQVAYWVRVNVSFGGCIVQFADLPVLKGHTGLLLGNDFIGKGRCVITPHPADDRRGSFVITDNHSRPISSPVQYVTANDVDVSCFHTVGDQGSEDTGATPLEETANPACTRSTFGVGDDDVPKEVSKSVNEVAPVAFAPRSTHVPAWAERIIQVRLPATIDESEQVALMPLESSDYGDLGVLVSPVLVSPDKDGMVPCRVINVSTEPITIPMLTPVARFMVNPTKAGVDVEYETAEIMEKVHIGVQDPEDLALIAKMLDDRRSLFRSTLGHCHIQRVSIDTPDIDSGRARPPCDPVKNRPPCEMDALLEANAKLLKNRLVEPARSPFNANPVPIPKPDGTYRQVLNWTRLNMLTTKDTYPLPNIECNLNALGKANWFTTLDLLQGFHQVELTDDAKPKTAYTLGNNQYQFTRLPMGLTSSPGAFMRLVDACLRGLPPGIALAYV